MLRPGKFYQDLVDELLRYAEHEARRSRKLGDGATAGEHADAAADIWAKTGKRPKVAPQADAPPFPFEIEHVWSWFNEIIAGCEAGWGPAIITWISLDAWCAMTGNALEPWEARALVRLGARRANVLTEERNAQNKDRADR